MSFIASTTEILAVRDERQLRIERVEADGRSLITLSTNIPGRYKNPPELAKIVARTVERLREEIGFCVIDEAVDLIGPFVIGTSPLSPEETKRGAVRIETEHRWGRLMDIDVYGEKLRQVDRALLGLKPRACLLCGEPARECILRKRHAYADLIEATDALLLGAERISVSRLGQELVRGASSELYLTPKPGLVDRSDNGSHPDLSFEKMEGSIGLLPRYFAEIERGNEEMAPLSTFVEMGREAENRMRLRIGTNAHNGLIFLGGLVLMASFWADGQVEKIREEIGRISGEFFRFHEPRGTHGESIRRDYAVGGVRTETELGMPSVFEHGWPSYRRALRAGYDKELAQYYLMAVLMQRVEDTTAVRRCGPGGLRRLKEDGGRIRGKIEGGEDPRELLLGMNEEYRGIGLTMGGVADCMAIVMSLEGSVERGSAQPRTLPRGSPALGQQE